MPFVGFGNTNLFVRRLALLLLSLSLLRPVAGGIMAARTDSSHGHHGPLDLDSPRYWGFLLPRGFAPLDVFGPLEVLQALARQTKLELALLSRTLEPATSEPPNPAMNKFNSSFFPTVVPTHTYEDDPPIEVLVVPGGAASRATDLGPELEYIRKVFPKLKYFITICTGAGIAAQSGVLDGHRATTNKAAWGEIIKMGPKVKWVSPARWVEDGKVWTSSGVTAGIDLAFAFVTKKFYNGSEIAEAAAGTMEHTLVHDWREDPWAAHFHVPPSN